MHFSKCRKPDLLNGCSQRPHGHLWADPEENHKLLSEQSLRSKQAAIEIVNRLPEMIVITSRPDALKKIISKLEVEIRATDLPESDHEADFAPLKSSHLKLVK